MIIDKIHVYNSATKQAEYICIDTKNILQLKTIGDTLYELTVSTNDVNPDVNCEKYIVTWLTGAFIKQEMENGDDEC